MEFQRLFFHWAFNQEIFVQFQKNPPNNSPEKLEFHDFLKTVVIF